MPKEVRIRGKRKYTLATDAALGFEQAKRLQKAEQLQQVRQRRDAGALAAPRASAAVEPPHKPPPALDHLPVEILQEIFLYGTNLRLPFTSRRLYRALTSSRVKTRLLAHLCLHGYRLEHNDPLPLPDRYSSQLAQSKRVNNDLVALAHAMKVEGLWDYVVCPRMVQADLDFAAVHTTLLRQSWVTYEMLRQEQWRHLSSFVRRRVQNFLREDAKATHAEVATQLALVDERLQSNFVWGAYSAHFVHQDWGWPGSETMMPWHPMYEFGVDNGATLSVFLPDSWGLNAMAWVTVEHASSSTTPSGHSAAHIQIWVQAFPSLSSLASIPSKLLHGSWTQGQGHFLTLISNAIFKRAQRPALFDWDPLTHGLNLNHYVDAHDGLHDAITARCLPAIRMLLGTSIPDGTEAEGSALLCDAEHSPADNTHVLPVHDKLPESWRRVGATALLRLDQLAGPWRAVNEPVHAGCFPPLGVEPTTEHLEAQLRAGHTDLRGSAVFYWLALVGRFWDDMPALAKVLLRLKFEVSDAERRDWIQELEDFVLP